MRTIGRTALAVLTLAVSLTTVMVANPQVAEAGIAEWRWPDASTTGVPAGTRLRPHRGTLNIRRAGTVIDGVDLQGCINILASNVTIRRSRIRCAGANAAVWQYTGRRGLVIEDSEIIGTSRNPAKAGIWSAASYVARRIEIRGTYDGAFVASGTTFRDSWVHSLASNSRIHGDGIQMTGGSGVTIVNNRFEHPPIQTSNILIKSDLAPIHNVAIGDNLFTGGIYNVFIHRGRYGYPTGVRVASNVFVRNTTRDGAMYVHGNHQLVCNIHEDWKPITVVATANGRERFTNPC